MPNPSSLSSETYGQIVFLNRGTKNGPREVRSTSSLNIGRSTYHNDWLAVTRVQTKGESVSHLRRAEERIRKVVLHYFLPWIP